MKRRFFQYCGLATAVVVAAGLMIIRSVEAQNYASGATSVSTPRTPDGKPDLSGMWNGVAVLRAQRGKCDSTQKGCFEARLHGAFPVRQEEDGLSTRVAS